MGDWKHREKKLEKRTKDKGLYKAFKQDSKNDKDGEQRKKRQDIQAKIRERDSAMGDIDLEE